MEPIEASHMNSKPGSISEVPFNALLTVGEAKVAGNINLAGGNVSVSLVSDALFLPRLEGDLHGVAKAGQVSLLGCLGSGRGFVNFADSAAHHAEPPFRHLVVGGRFVSSDEACLTGMDFELEGVADDVFADLGPSRFGTLLTPNESTLEAVLEDAQFKENSVKGFSGQPLVSYFNGDHVLLPKADTALGQLSGHIGMTGDWLMGPSRIRPTMHLDFSESPATVDEARDKLNRLRSFFGWIRGAIPRVAEVRLYTAKLSADAGGRVGKDGLPDQGLALHSRETPMDGGGDRTGALIHATEHPDHFMDVLAKWVQRNEDRERRSANDRFSALMRRAGYLEDEIISSANCFDLLPQGDKPEPEPGRKIPTLESTIGHRAKAVTAALGGLPAVKDALGDIGVVIEQAVRCRNHYVHGPRPRDGDWDFDSPSVVVGLTRTLRFIYMTSELLACGWDPRLALRSCDGHPTWDRFRFADRRVFRSQP